MNCCHQVSRTREGLEGGRLIGRQQDGQRGLLRRESSALLPSAVVRQGTPHPLERG